MYEINDRRTDAEKAATVGYVVFTDKFMSGWGKASGGSSYYALAVIREVRWENGVAVMPRIDRIIETLLAQGERRTDMIRGRYVAGSTYRPSRRSCAHLSIVGPTGAPRWYDDNDRF